MRRIQTAIVLTTVLAFLGVARQVDALGTETFGNEVFHGANYKDWPGILPLVNDGARVYQRWVNGNEDFLYRGDTERLNRALRDFADIEAKTHEVVLRPAPGVGRSFHGKEIAHDWQLHINGGISRHVTTLDRGEQVWNPDPVLTVYVGGDIDLSRLEIPDGVTLVDTPTLGKRIAAAMTASKDKTVRGWGNGELARVDPYSEANLGTIAGMLDDPDNWVRLNAAGALASFGKKAAPHIPALKKLLASDDEPLKERARKSIEQIEQAPDKADEERRHAEVQKQIAAFIAAPRKASDPPRPEGL